mgnify:CR=1 FL=1
MFRIKYTVCLLALAVLVTFTTNAQKYKNTESSAVDANNLVFSAGYGAPSIIRSYLKIRNIINSDSTVTRREVLKAYFTGRTYGNDMFVKGYGPIIFKAEYMLSKRWGVNINGAYSRSQVAWMEDGWDTIEVRYRKFEAGIIGKELSGMLRVNYHYLKRAKVDMYAGLGYGRGLIRLQSYTKAHTSMFNIRYDIPRPISLEATTGIRYFPHRNIGIYSEFGVGKSWIIFRRFFLPEAILQGGVVVKLFNKKS